MPRLKSKLFLVIIIIPVILTTVVSAHMVGNNPYRRREILNPKGKYQLEWLIDWTTKRISFEVIVATLGYVGFGLSDSGKMSGADLVIGGVTSEGKSYFSDYHAVASQVPEVDLSQDWELNLAKENGSHTFLNFSRPFDTGDNYHDYPITENKISLIWAYGERDNPTDYHHANRGSFNVHLIHPDYTPYIERDPVTGDPVKIGDSSQENGIKVWTIPQVIRVSPSDTTYWCTMHRGPRLSSKHHFVGFDLRFGSEESRKSVHHMQMSRCYVPQNKSAESIFSPFLSDKGQLCYMIDQPTGPMPTEYCMHIVLGLAAGSRTIFTPPHVGHPLGLSQEEFYLLQVHYDNPQRRSDLTVDLKLDVYYTSQLRQHEGGFLGIGHIFPGTPPAVLVPPSSINHEIYGHCDPSCTNKIIPLEGIKIFAISLHSHNSGRRMELQHWRNGQELNPVQKDDNYAFSFQQFRVLNREAHVLPGDHLIMKCGYDNTWTNTTVVGGFSSRNEMCAAFVLYYNRIDYSGCISDIVSEAARRQFLAGAGNITWSESRLEYIVNSPRSLAGQSVTQVSDNHVSWTIQKREDLQKFHREYPRVNICIQDINY